MQVVFVICPPNNGQQAHKYHRWNPEQAHAACGRSVKPNSNHDIYSARTDIPNHAHPCGQCWPPDEDPLGGAAHASPRRAQR